MPLDQVLAVRETLVDIWTSNREKGEARERGK